jgi:serine/threonine protein kinase
LDAFFTKDTVESDHTTLNSIYFVMDYYKGNLESLLYDFDKAISKKEALILSYNLLCAVKYLHSANIMHRDLKPDNILLTEDMQVKICDFGLSRGLMKDPSSNKRVRSLSQTCFTRFYRPPEVILGAKEYDEKSDVWSIGCILSEII